MENNRINEAGSLAVRFASIIARLCDEMQASVSRPAHHAIQPTERGMSPADEDGYLRSHELQPPK